MSDLLVQEMAAVVMEELDDLDEAVADATEGMPDSDEETVVIVDQRVHFAPMDVIDP